MVKTWKEVVDKDITNLN